MRGVVGDPEAAYVLVGAGPAHQGGAGRLPVGEPHGGGYPVVGDEIDGPARLGGSRCDCGRVLEEATIRAGSSVAIRGRSIHPLVQASHRSGHPHLVAGEMPLEMAAKHRRGDGRLMGRHRPRRGTQGEDRRPLLGGRRPDTVDDRVRPGVDGGRQVGDGVHAEGLQLLEARRGHAGEPGELLHLGGDPGMQALQLRQCAGGAELLDQADDALADALHPAHRVRWCVQVGGEGVEGPHRGPERPPGRTAADPLPAHLGERHRRRANSRRVRRSEVPNRRPHVLIVAVPRGSAWETGSRPTAAGVGLIPTVLAFFIESSTRPAECHRRSG